MKLSTKMLLGTAILAVAPILITSFLVGGGAVNLSRDSLTQAVQSQLVSLREMRKQQLNDYFRLAGQLAARHGRQRHTGGRLQKPAPVDHSGC
jgi:methyl-accepting chemotaxis protein